MAIPFLSDIKLNGNQIKELVVDHKSGANPSTGYHGQLIFRTDENKIYINTSTTPASPSWSSIAGDITGVTAGTGLSGGGTVGDITLSIDSSQTGISTIYNTGLIVGRDTDNNVNFATDNEINFTVNAIDRVKITTSAIQPVTDNQIDLGTIAREFKDLYLDGTATIDGLAIGSSATITSVDTDISSVSATDDTLASALAIKTYVDGITPSTVTVSDSTADTAFPVVFHDESNALLDDTGAFIYNPSSGTLSVPNLTVSGVTTTVNTETILLADNIIVLNSNATGSAGENAGIEVERGDDANVKLQWNETDDDWEFEAYNHAGTPALVTYKVPRTHAATIAGAADTDYTVTHNLGTKDVIVQIYDINGTDATVHADVVRTNTNVVTVSIGTVSATNDLRVLISTVG